LSTAAEESNSTLLADPSATLRGADVADGTWLLACIAGALPAAGA